MKVDGSWLKNICFSVKDVSEKCSIAIRRKSGCSLLYHI